MKTAPLALLAMSTVTAAATPEWDMPGVCFQKQWPALEVMEALGYEIEPTGGVGATWVLRHASNTRDWRQVWGKVRRPAETSGGLLPVVTGLRRYRTVLVLMSNVKDWRDPVGR